MKRTFSRIFTLLPALALTLGLMGCVSLAQESGGAEDGDVLIGYYATVQTQAERDAAHAVSEEVSVSGGQLTIRPNTIPAALDEADFTLRCEAVPGYAMLYIADGEQARSGHDPHFTECSTNVHITDVRSEHTSLCGTLLYDVTGIAEDGSFRRFDHEPTAADFGGQPFTAYQSSDDGGETLYWEGAAGEQLTASLYAVYRTAAGDCYLKKTSADMSLSGTADGGSSALTAKAEITRRSGGEQTATALEVAVQFQPALPYELRCITQFDESHNAVAVTEFAAGEAPETLRWEENAAYMIAERCYTDASGESHSVFDVIDREDSFYLYPLWNGERVATSASIDLAGAEE